MKCAVYYYYLTSYITPQTFLNSYFNLVLLDPPPPLLSGKKRKELLR